MTDDLSRASRFLDAFNRVEALLSKRVKGEEGKLAFGELVRKSKELTDPQVRKLLDIANLRNAIVHYPGGWGGDPIADPREEIVEWLEGQVDLIERPPRVITSLKLQPPIVIDSNADLSEFLEEVRKNFSQSPVRLDNGELSLVTTNAVARWVASGYEADEGVALGHVKTHDVLKFTEEEDRLVVRPKSLRVVEAARLFSGAVMQPTPAAIVLTEDGKHEHKPIGICVRADVARLLTALGVD